MDAFTAIADPVRRDIVMLLRAGPCAAGVIAAAFPQISRPAVSRHLRVLRAAEILTVEPAGRERRYRLDGAGLAVVDTWLRSVRAGDWEQRLDALETEVHRTRRDRGQHAATEHDLETNPRSTA